MPSQKTAPPPEPERQVQLAENRKARFDYQIESRVEAGIALRGTEIKSLRAGHANLRDGYARVENGEVWLGIARGRKRFDKRQVIKEREATREMDAAIRRRVGRG